MKRYANNRRNRDHNPVRFGFSEVIRCFCFGFSEVADTDVRTYLFYQGNNDGGRTWYITNVEVFWKGGKPVLSDK